MATGIYGLKFFYEFYSDNNRHNRVEIRDYYESGDTNSIEVRGINNSFEIEYPEINIVTDGIMSCGATLSFFYKGEEGVLSTLFTPEMNRYKVMHYIDGQKNFIGYLNTELYDEDFSTSTTEIGVGVQVTANNGFSNLERVKFIDDNNDLYTDFSTLKELLEIIIGKVGLEYNNLYFKNFFNVVIDNDTNTLSSNYLEDICINNGNWYDEDLQPNDCKDILNNVLIANGLKLQTIGDDIFIYPIDLLASASGDVEFTHYTLPTFAKQPNINIDFSSIELTTIGFKSNSIRKGYVSAINNQEIEYDPYCVSDIIAGKVNNVSYIDGYVNSESKGSGEYAWTKEYYTTHTNYITNQNIPIGENITTPKIVKAYKTTEPSKPIVYIEFDCYHLWENHTASWVIENKVNPIYLMNGSKMKITKKMYFETKDDWENPDENGINNDSYIMSLGMYVRSGDKYYSNSTKKFTNSSPFDPTTGAFTGSTDSLVLVKANNLTEKYMEFDKELEFETVLDFAYDLQEGIDNNIVIGIINYNALVFSVKYRMYDTKVVVYDDVAELHNIKLDNLVKSSERVVDERYINSGQILNLKLGSILQQPDFKINNNNQRGAFFYSPDKVNFTPISKFEYNGVYEDSEYHIIEQIITNKSTPSTTLNLTLNNTFKINKALNYGNYLGDMKLMINGCVIDYLNEKIECKLLEIKKI
ncbi:hypothetical protein E9993_01605 [Labilibacter sediminis]|nr:hypothetical protein E9993_01605 [Labilibacter sediminis]